MMMRSIKIHVKINDVLIGFVDASIMMKLIKLLSAMESLYDRLKYV